MLCADEPKTGNTELELPVPPLRLDIPYGEQAFAYRDAVMERLLRAEIERWVLSDSPNT